MIFPLIIFAALISGRLDVFFDLSRFLAFIPFRSGRVGFRSLEC